MDLGSGDLSGSGEVIRVGKTSRIRVAERSRGLPRQVGRSDRSRAGPGLPGVGPTPRVSWVRSLCAPGGLVHHEPEHTGRSAEREEHGDQGDQDPQGSGGFTSHRYSPPECA